MTVQHLKMPNGDLIDPREAEHDDLVELCAAGGLWVDVEVEEESEVEEEEDSTGDEGDPAKPKTAKKTAAPRKTARKQVGG